MSMNMNMDFGTHLSVFYILKVHRSRFRKSCLKSNKGAMLVRTGLNKTVYIFDLVGRVSLGLMAIFGRSPSSSKPVTRSSSSTAS